MNLQEIKTAIANGQKVYWSHKGYEAVANGEDYDILCLSNNHRIGLTWADGVTLNGKEEDFFSDEVKEEKIFNVAYDHNVYKPSTYEQLKEQEQFKAVVKAENLEAAKVKFTREYNKRAMYFSFKEYKY